MKLHPTADNSHPLPHKPKEVLPSEVKLKHSGLNKLYGFKPNSKTL